LANLGTSRINAGRYAEAAGLFQRALDADPECERAQGDPARLETRPVCRKTLNNLGAARAQLGDLPEARRLLRLAVSADPGDESARSNLARVEAMMERSGRGPRAP
jgi:Flp pilus assembly protein TadD